jgi:hypothetical protein
MLHDMTGSVGGMARSLGRGSAYEVTDMRWLFARSATKPVL